MYKAEFAAAVAEKVNLTTPQAAAVIDAVIETIESTVSGGDKVSFVGFGTFSLKERPERVGRNVRTGETVTIPASKTPVFKAGKGFKDLVK